MAWETINRRTIADEDLGPGLTVAIKDKIRAFLPRYPSKRAVLLPALHITQEALGRITLRSMREIAELLEMPPSAVMDVVTFYSHFWTKPRGKKLICVCRSLTCELMGGKRLLDVLKERLGIDEGETTPDGEYSLMTEECLAACEYGPCMLINEKLHKCVSPADLDGILADPNNDKLDMPRSDLFDPPGHGM
ncbi:MAG: NADH-quinone oxidoreductase subunit NuoE [Phycisphaerae bacterium]|nr:NADH-quinone oxidoreductase subunit NuoE [Phycisphaerae bacterium]